MAQSTLFKPSNCPDVRAWVGDMEGPQVILIERMLIDAEEDCMLLNSGDT